MSVEVVVVGAAGVDTCVYLTGEVDPSADATFTTNRDGVGQAGGYAARGYAALGLRTAYCGGLGDDEAGRLVRRVLEGEGIDLSTCFLAPAGTARSVNLMSPDGGRRAFYDGRADPDPGPDLTAVVRLLRRARLCHLNIPDWARRVIPVAREAGVPVVCDLQDVRSADDRYRQDFVDGADVLCFSTANGVNPHLLMQQYWQRRPQLVLVAGLGSLGCAVGVAGEVVHHPAPDSPLAVVDTNGAGDALAVGFATAYLLEGLPSAQAAERGQRAARVTCAQRLPKQALATRADVTARPGAS